MLIQWRSIIVFEPKLPVIPNNQSCIEICLALLGIFWRNRISRSFILILIVEILMCLIESSIRLLPNSKKKNIWFLHPRDEPGSPTVIGLTCRWLSGCPYCFSTQQSPVFCDSPTAWMCVAHNKRPAGRIYFSMQMSDFAGILDGCSYLGVFSRIHTQEVRIESLLMAKAVVIPLKWLLNTSAHVHQLDYLMIISISSYDHQVPSLNRLPSGNLI